MRRINNQNIYTSTKCIEKYGIITASVMGWLLANKVSKTKRLYKDISELFRISEPTIRKHIEILFTMGVIRTENSGVPCKTVWIIDPEPLKKEMDWIG